MQVQVCGQNIEVNSPNPHPTITVSSAEITSNPGSTALARAVVEHDDGTRSIAYLRAIIKNGRTTFIMATVLHDGETVRKANASKVI